MESVPGVAELRSPSESALAIRWPAPHTGNSCNRGREPPPARTPHRFGPLSVPASASQRGCSVHLALLVPWSRLPHYLNCLCLLYRLCLLDDLLVHRERPPLHLRSNALPQRVMVLSYRHPPCRSRLQLVGSHQHLISEHVHPVVEADTHQHHSANQVGGHRVAVASYLDVAIPTNMAVLDV